MGQLTLVAVCEWCGDDYIPNAAIPGHPQRMGGKQQKYCCADCRVAYKVASRTERLRAARPPAFCIGCGASIPDKRSGRKRCRPCAEANLKKLELMRRPRLARRGDEWRCDDCGAVGGIYTGTGKVPARCVECTKEKRNKVWRERYAADPAKFRRYQRTWYRRTIDERRLQSRRASHLRRLRVSGADTRKILDKEWRRLYRSPCFYCGAVDAGTVDHVIPISRGGRQSIGNLVPACGSCNSSKHDKLLVEWRYRNPPAQGAQDAVPSQEADVGVRGRLGA